MSSVKEAVMRLRVRDGLRCRIQDLEALDFDKGGGLIPAVVQDTDSSAVLMLGYMNRAALEASLARGRVVFFSRSKARLWEKGETSGHALEIVSVRVDCDRDALLVTARPLGPTCHLGTGSCFGDAVTAPAEGTPQLKFLNDLEAIISQRMSVRPHDSYTARLVAGGIKRIAQKVGEEGLEVALAATSGSDEELTAEGADLLYHLLVLLKARGLALEQIVDALRVRHAGRADV
jgi:phosphoribosyl-ATP pyrophosphohydrolase/phosphoribosyl-AMP cyclohydrolase